MNSYILEVCKIGQGQDCCRYLLMGSGGFQCAKGMPDLLITPLDDGKWHLIKDLLDERVRKGTITARGDNCEGQQDLEHASQTEREADDSVSGQAAKAEGKTRTQ